MSAGACSPDRLAGAGGEAVLIREARSWRHRPDAHPTGAARLQAELALYEGDVPAALEGGSAVTQFYQISPDAFLFGLPSGLAFHYRRGVGTVYRRSATTSDAEVSLFFEGSVFGAIAWINGYVPLHASAVEHGGQIYAFTGRSGEGKSTLATALAGRGMALCSDDLLVLDLTDPSQVIALPGAGRMKLWEDALVLTGHAATQEVRPGAGKYYVSDVAFAERRPFPLRRLYFLETDEESPAGVTRIEGASRFNWMRSAYYRPRLFSASAGQGRYFQTGIRLSNAVEMRRFNRSRDRGAFERGVDRIAADIHAAASAPHLP